MTPAPERILLLFVDGLGLGRDVETNPVTTASLPTLDALLAPRRLMAADAPWHGADASLVGIDVRHGAPGTPQSGTGHTTLLTGVDAVARFGRHYGPWVPTALRPLVAERSILARTKIAGRRVAFANAYPEELMERVPDGVPVAEAVTSGRLGPLRSGPPLAALGAGVLTRHTDALARGDALASEITNDGWIQRLHRDLPRITPAAAGRNLARITADHDLTLFAHYTPDYVGHRGTWNEAIASLERIDAFLAGLLEELPDRALLIVASDHGNIEDTTREHTTNLAVGLVVGRGHAEVAGRLEQLWDVPRVILHLLGIEPGDDEPG
ncbi:MAG: alkaline phosphatase family protein [Longimicrobiales bacterium]